SHLSGHHITLCLQEKDNFFTALIAFILAAEGLEIALTFADDKIGIIEHAVKIRGGHFQDSTYTVAPVIYNLTQFRQSGFCSVIGCRVVQRRSALHHCLHFFPHLHQHLDKEPVKDYLSCVIKQVKDARVAVYRTLKPAVMVNGNGAAQGTFDGSDNVDRTEYPEINNIAGYSKP